MLRLLRLLFLLTLIAAIMLFAAWMIGSTRPALELSTIMSGVDGLACNHPCLFGVRPGETTFEQATQILHSHPLTRDARWITPLTLQLAGSPTYVAFSITKDKQVDSIVFSDTLEDTGIPVPDSLADSIHLGELILAFGTPNIALPASDYFVAGFPDAGIIAAIARPDDLKTYVRPDTPINMIMIAAVRPCPLPINMIVHPWVGFAPYQRYLNDPRAYRIAHRVSGVPVPPFAQCQVNQ